MITYSVNNIPVGELDNRFAMQRAILSFLATVGQPIPDPAYAADARKIGHLPTNGDVVDALGYPRTKVSSASVSRSLRRLRKAGKIEAHHSIVYIRGKGARYSLKAGRAQADGV